MSALDLARWQFAMTSVYHFVFVPLTIGLAPIVAAMQTAWYRTGDERWGRLTAFFGKIFLLNFAIGVVTGIVQEFQFGMNWSVYSEFVGDVFGAPLAMEALIAFFIESVFIGVWMFGRRMLSARAHLASIWMVALAVNLSAWFILAANAFMQHPVGTSIGANGRAQLDSVWTMLFSETALVTLAHTVSAAGLTAATVVLGVSAWWVSRLVRAGRTDDAKVYRPALRAGLVMAIVAGVAVVWTGHTQGQIMVAEQPMKMAAAEALCHTTEGAPFSLVAFNTASGNCEDIVAPIEIPGLASYLATGSMNDELQGITEAAASQAVAFGAYGTNGSGYIPNVTGTYWSFRVMIGLGVLAIVFALWGLRCTRASATDAQQIRFGRVAAWMVPVPYIANLSGWIFTEIGRSPWIVVPNLTGDLEVRMRIDQAASTFVESSAVMVSLIAFAAIYALLGVIWFRLIRQAAKEGVAEPPDTSTDPDQADHLIFAY